jgi:hypothetical protein
MKDTVRNLPIPGARAARTRNAAAPQQDNVAHNQVK